MEDHKEIPYFTMPSEICIENLDKDVDVAVLSSVFKEHGRILSCSIDVDKHFFSKGRGYVCFDDPSSAQRAVKFVNNSKILKKQVKVTLEPSDIDADLKALKQRYTKIYVKNIPPSWGDFDLKREFRKFGDINEAQVSNNDGKPNGYGFVLFADHFSAKAAVDMKHTSLTVEPFIPKSLRKEIPLSPESSREKLRKSIQFNNLHVKNIPKSIDDDDLVRLFEKFGHITSAKVARDNLQMSKGFGFVCFESQTEAEVARSHMNGYSLGSNTLVVNFHQKKEARQQYLATKNMEAEANSQLQAKAALKSAFQPKNNVLFSFSSK